MRMSASALHDLAQEAFRVGNRGRLSLCESLRVLHETRLYFELGFPSLSAYAGTFFHLRRTETFEYVRVARALLELTELREAFGRGAIGWSAVKAVSRVATVDSQSKWIDFAGKNPVERVVAEARDAFRRGRDTPRESPYGLPNLDEKLVLRFARSDMEKVRLWLEEGAERAAEKTGSNDVTLEQAVLFLCEEAAAYGAGSRAENGRSAESASADSAGPGEAGAPGEADAPGAPDAPGEASEASEPGEADEAGAPDDGPRAAAGPRARIVYHRCPDCRRARAATRDGFVEVGSEEVERYEGDAEVVVIDGPTPPGMRRRILAREAGFCGNPRCHHRADHCHHIVFRAQGGKTEMANEVGICATCHALVHAGLLRVRGRADGDLVWEPVASGPVVGHDMTSDSSAADRLPVLEVAGGAEARAANAPEESADADSFDADAPDVEALSGSLVRLGVSAARSRRVIDASIASLTPSERTEANVLRHAVASL